jgi:hypothetical protein
VAGPFFFWGQRVLAPDDSHAEVPVCDHQAVGGTPHLHAEVRSPGVSLTAVLTLVEVPCGDAVHRPGW